MLTPCLEEINRHSNIEVTFKPHQSKGRAVVSLMFTIRSRKEAKKPLTPKEFIKDAETEKDAAIDLADPIFGNEIYQLMAANKVELNDEVRRIVERSNSDKEYRAYVKDTVRRCAVEIRQNPSIKTPGGYTLSAIMKDYHKGKREADAELSKKDEETKSELEKKEMVEQLVKE